MNHFEIYNLAMGVLAAVGVLYLAYCQRFVVCYRRFLHLLIAGFLLFAIGGPAADLFAPGLAHFAHGLSAVFVVFALYDPVRNDLRRDEWTSLLFEEPSDLRHPGQWMVPMDDEILELFHSAHLVLTPAIIAYNIDRSREEVNRRLCALEEHELVERVERGKYRITDVGKRYLHGEFSARGSAASE